MVQNYKYINKIHIKISKEKNRMIISIVIRHVIRFNMHSCFFFLKHRDQWILLNMVNYIFNMILEVLDSAIKM